MSRILLCIVLQTCCAAGDKFLFPHTPQPYFAHLCCGNIGLFSTSKGWHFSGSWGKVWGVGWLVQGLASHCVLGLQDGWVWPRHCQALPREEVSMFTGNAEQGLGGEWRRGSLPPGTLKMCLGAAGTEGRRLRMKVFVGVGKCPASQTPLVLSSLALKIATLCRPPKPWAS